MVTTSTTTVIRGAVEGVGGVAATATQKVVIVNGSTEIVGLLETVLETGHYDIVFVESNEHAYSQIKRVQPNLVILCMQINDRDGFLVLSMLKLDEATRAIPVLTYTTEDKDQESAEQATRDPIGDQMFAPTLAVRMN
jgi:PleD family two-component response regulator